ncbi:hypothetical protein [Aquimarina pacifica]|uniref:hypothetical protein n=1 Tax=Aquimarina pacifica TaxID=1296415 RepID=UPI0012686112|nr:hypothetical protein [Aquimarina pacifica]
MKYLKNIGLANLIFYFFSVSVIIIAIFFDKKLLMFAIPATITSIGALYIKNDKNINFWYLGSLITMSVCNVLIYIDFIKYFLSINILITLYHFLSVISLIDYIDFKKIKRTNFFSFSLIIATLLILYLIYAVVDLIFDFILPYIGFSLLSVVGLMLYVIVSFVLYKTEVYKSGIKLLIAAYIWMFVHAMTPINEISINFRIFTVLIIAMHIIGLYLFMRFLIENEPTKNQSDSEKYL